MGQLLSFNFPMQQAIEKNNSFQVNEIPANQLVTPGSGQIVILRRISLDSVSTNTSAPAFLGSVGNSLFLRYVDPFTDSGKFFHLAMDYQSPLNLNNFTKLVLQTRQSSGSTITLSMDYQLLDVGNPTLNFFQTYPYSGLFTSLPIPITLLLQDTGSDLYIKNLLYASNYVSLVGKINIYVGTSPTQSVRVMSLSANTNTSPQSIKAGFLVLNGQNIYFSYDGTESVTPGVDCQIGITLNTIRLESLS